MNCVSKGKKEVTKLHSLNCFNFDGILVYRCSIKSFNLLCVSGKQLDSNKGHNTRVQV